MGFENQQTNLTIVGLEDSIKPIVTYVTGSVRMAYGLRRFVVKSEDIDKLALMEITLPHHFINATHEVLDISYNLSRNICCHTDISLQDKVSVVYNVLRDRYKLPITPAYIVESLYIERKYHPLVREINQFIDGIVCSTKGSTQEEQPVDPIADAINRQQENDATEEENPYLLSLDMEMKGLTVEQYSELITLVTSYVKKNNAFGTKNCSLVIK